MVYRATSQRGIVGWLLLLMILLITINDVSRWLLYFQIILSLVLLTLLLINYKFEIKEDHLTYQIVLFKWALYNTIIYPNRIITINFKRVGWLTKGAIIRVNKGFNIRIVHFVPIEVLEDLIDFANDNGIPYCKTKDYF